MPEEITDQDWKYLQEIWDYLLIESELPDTADVIVIGGSGAMIDSAERAADLYLGGVSQRILVSGFANPYHDARETEATILARELMCRGVPESVILLDHQATNTGENIINAAQILRESDIHNK